MINNGIVSADSLAHPSPTADGTVAVKFGNGAEDVQTLPGSTLPLHNHLEDGELRSDQFNTNFMSTTGMSEDWTGLLVVDIGRTFRQVGDITGLTLYFRVHDALESLCQADKPQCKHDKYIQIKNEAVTGPWRYAPSYFQIGVQGSWWGHNNEVRKIMLEHIATIIEIATFNDKDNCVYENNRKYCNVPNILTIVIPKGKDSDGQDFRLAIRIKTPAPVFSLKSFNCVGLLTPANSIVDYWRPELNDATGHNLDRNVVCSEGSGLSNAGPDSRKLRRETTDLASFDPASVKLHSTNSFNGLLYVKISRTWKQIGTTTSHTLYENVLHALRALCLVGRPGCTDSKWSGWDTEIVIAPFQYAKIRVGIEVWDSWIGQNTGIRELMIKTVAGILERALWNNDNCVNENHHQRYCNVPDHISVVIPKGDGPWHDFSLSIRTVMWPPEGARFSLHRFDCVGLLTPANEVVDALRPEYNKATGLDLDRNVVCDP